ncbi:VOC family protein [Burkholderia sp. Ax-1719]|uniref:VOC family protein n=1 Tax=Burkholderia sp. Ax-1719 TaxID=2608334 RepID=UPI0014203084|nr:VOC family protein [Burkholderia sp. Ax-1719]NIE63644.1 VOC family protein [Burkholderia sp. Ax-1719]
MPISMTRLILYVHDVDRLQAFYHDHFGLPIIEEVAGEWAVLQAGAVEIALHRVGEPYRRHAGAAGGSGSNAKIVFQVTQALAALRTRLIDAGVQMREIKRYDGLPYQMCDGCDPEGNVFQLCQPD